MKELTQHRQLYAITCAPPTIQIAAQHFHAMWGHYMVKAAHEPNPRERKYFEEGRDKMAKCLSDLCQAVDAAMQLAGDMINANDAADEWGLTDSAYEAMDRALDRTS